MPLRRVKQTQISCLSTTDSQMDLNFMSVKEITKELNCLRKVKKELRGKRHEYKEKIRLPNEELSKSACFDIDK